MKEEYSTVERVAVTVAALGAGLLMWANADSIADAVPWWGALLLLVSTAGAGLLWLVTRR